MIMLHMMLIGNTMVCLWWITISSAAIVSVKSDIWWWEMAADSTGQQSSLSDDPYSIGGSSMSFCHRLQGLSAGQTRMCQLYEDHMKSVGRGIRLAVSECQWLFSDRRWNCTTSMQSGNRSTTLFGYVIHTGSRETAFTHAILAAGVVHAISRSCRDGELRDCGCSSRRRPAELDREWEWGGCGDNTEYGYNFGRGFLDTREREKNNPRYSRPLARMLMNLHNNEAGRRAVSRSSRAVCKCHGVSGSCNLRTCWNQLAPFRDIGKQLKDSYDRATRVKFNQHGTALISADKRFNKPTKQDLIYIDQSPNYCQANETTGSLGTTGRRCYRSSPATDGCDLMCCGRGYNIERSRVVERCQCKFQWCCYVKCKMCERVLNIYTCK